MCDRNSANVCGDVCIKHVKKQVVTGGFLAGADWLVKLLTFSWLAAWVAGRKKMKKNCFGPKMAEQALLPRRLAAKGGFGAMIRPVFVLLNFFINCERYQSNL